MPGYSGGGGGPPPGVTGDGLTPGGLIIAGALTAGDVTKTVTPDFHVINGQLVVQDSPGNNSDRDPAFQAQQQTDLTADNSLPATRIERSGVLNGHQYTVPVFDVNDDSGSTGGLQSWSVGGVHKAQIGPAGGVRLFDGLAPPTAPRTLAQAAIDAITDANAKTAVQACANALSDMGALTLT